MSAVDARAAPASALAGASAVGSQILEQTNDPMLFHMELLGKEGWDPADGKHLVVSVTGGFSPREGNTLTARCTIKRLPVSGRPAPPRRAAHPPPRWQAPSSWRRRGGVPAACCTA